MIIDRDELRKQQEKTPANSLAVAIEQLFKNELSGTNWKRYSKDGIIELVDQAFKHAVTTKDVHYATGRNLIRKIKKQESSEMILLVLSEYMFK